MYGGGFLAAIALILGEARPRKGAVCGAATGICVPTWVGGWARHMRPTVSQARLLEMVMTASRLDDSRCGNHQERKAYARKSGAIPTRPFTSLHVVMTAIEGVAMGQGF